VESEELLRRYVGLAPRGVTIEYANDQLVETLQRSVRAALRDPRAVAARAGVSEASIPDLVSLYGVDVVYGSTLKDVEAAARSFESQIPLDPVRSATLTGRTEFDDVRATLERLDKPEVAFDDRIHLIAASSMMSHGVDVDRLNVMVMLGLPLATAEFIQATARVGRRHPGLVLVLHKIARERDAAVFRMFPAFIGHMDRLVDPVPVTAKSRRVLEKTFAGMLSGRVLGVHEPAALARGLKPLTTAANVKQGFTRLPVTEADELAALISLLGFSGPLDDLLRTDLTEQVRFFFRTLNDPASAATFASDCFLNGKPMLSLRDVEEQVPVYDTRRTR
jgi:hypothetical protein